MRLLSNSYTTDERRITGLSTARIASFSVSNSRRIAGYHVVVAAGSGGLLAPGIAAWANDLSGSFGPEQLGYNAAGVDGRGKLGVALVASLLHDIALSPGEDVVVVEVDTCLLPETPAGEYALTLEYAEFIDARTGRATYPDRLDGILTVPRDVGPRSGCVPAGDSASRHNACGDLVDPPEPPDPNAPRLDFSRGDANTDGRLSISDAVMIRRFLFNGDRPPPCLDSADVDDSGAVDLRDAAFLLRHVYGGSEQPPPPYLDMGPDPTEDSLACARYDVVEAEETRDVIEIGNAHGVPGRPVDIPVYLSNTVEVEAFQLILSYDPGSFEPDGLVVVDDTYYEGTGVEEQLNFNLVAPLESEANVLVVAWVPSLTRRGFETPPGIRRLVFKIRGMVPVSAKAGAVVILGPPNDGEGVGPLELRNEVTHRGEARFVSTLPSVLPGRLEIVGDVTLFMRGDSNGDENVDLSDAVTTLRYLFVGESPPHCLDAADANDDGLLNLADPVATLQFLYRDGAPLPPPSGTPGEDPTPDSMGCVVRAR